jgi:hypothetical protein
LPAASRKTLRVAGNRPSQTALSANPCQTLRVDGQSARPNRIAGGFAQNRANRVARRQAPLKRNRGQASRWGTTFSLFRVSFENLHLTLYLILWQSIRTADLSIGRQMALLAPAFRGMPASAPPRCGAPLALAR